MFLLFEKFQLLLFSTLYTLNLLQRRWLKRWWPLHSKFDPLFVIPHVKTCHVSLVHCAQPSWWFTSINFVTFNKAGVCLACCRVSLFINLTWNHAHSCACAKEKHYKKAPVDGVLFMDLIFVSLVLAFVINLLLDKFSYVFRFPILPKRTFVRCCQRVFYVKDILLGVVNNWKVEVNKISL